MILVPFNFNLTGENAIRYAIKISQIVNLDIVVFHATETNATSEEKSAQLKRDVNAIVTQLNKENKVQISTHIAVGDYEIIYHGSGSIHDKIGDYKFRISANSFFQTNTIQAEKLYNIALEYAGLKGDEIIYDETILN